MRNGSRPAILAAIVSTFQGCTDGSTGEPQEAGQHGDGTGSTTHSSSDTTGSSSNPGSSSDTSGLSSDTTESSSSATGSSSGDTATTVTDAGSEATSTGSTGTEGDWSVAPCGWPTKGWETKSPDEVGLDETKLALAREYAASFGGSGYVTRGGCVVMSWGDPAQRYDLKSTTKSFGTTALGIALHDDVIALQDKAASYHPDFGTPPESNADTGWLDDITIFHLANANRRFRQTRRVRTAAVCTRNEVVVQRWRSELAGRLSDADLPTRSRGAHVRARVHPAGHHERRSRLARQCLSRARDRRHRAP